MPAEDDRTGDPYRELFVWLSRRDDVVGVRFDEESIDFVPEQQTYEDGTPAPSEVNITIPRAAFEAMWPDLLQGGQEADLTGRWDMPELAAFSLFDVHLEESVNALTAPGPDGWVYVDGDFTPL